ncbi:MAG: hypothetical protein HY756_05830 [Nitrospirae bacterium]|nr:hypothetical protein [Nitrospirota bacterium]
MSKKKIFTSENAPKPKGPYSQAVIHQGLLYLSGQIPIDPKTNTLLRGSIEEEAKLVLDNMKAIITDAGAGMQDALKVTCYLSDMEDFGRFNEVYKEYFTENPPVRTTIQAGRLPLDVQIEMDAIVALPEKK